MKQKEKLTILVPFKDRHDRLEVFIPYLKYYLNNYFNHIDYNIVVIEQDNNLTFNKGVLFNTGFELTSGYTDYYVLHDIDELPISANYNYHEKPMHLSVNIFTLNDNGLLKNEYQDKNFDHRGGAFLINKENYLKVNGHSNLFWGKCKIDINFANRCEWAGIKSFRYHHKELNDSGYYMALKSNTKYQDSDLNLGKRTFEELQKRETFDDEGFNTLKFKIKERINHNDYTLYKVDFNYDDYILDNYLKG
jgi:hypothetical protein